MGFGLKLLPEDTKKIGIILLEVLKFYMRQCDDVGHFKMSLYTKRSAMNFTFSSKYSGAHCISTCCKYSMYWDRRKIMVDFGNYNSSQDWSIWISTFQQQDLQENILSI